MDSSKQQNTIEGFYKHREAEADPRAVLRSSALFYVVQSAEVQTDILLFNYWLHKRGLSGLDLLVTLRDASGNTVCTEASVIDFRGAKTLRIEQLLHKASLPPPFEGSIEIEILSREDLTIPYPAVVIRYYGPNWHSTTHSYSRVLSELSGDRPDRMAAFQKTSEGNWTIHEDPGLESFFVIHNGPTAVPAHSLSMTLTNAHGELLKAEVADVSLMPYETRVFYPHRLMDVGGHLGGSPGCLEVQAVVCGVFPRMLSGSRRLSDGALVIDHSNFNYTGEAGGLDTLSTADSGTKKPLGFIVPTIADPNWQCFTDFYPTYPDRDYQATLRIRTADGEQSDKAEISIGSQKASGVIRVPVSDMVGKHGSVGAVDFTITHQTRVPTRFHMGIHYARKGGLPAHLIDGPMPYVAKGIRSRWFPVLLDSETTTYLFISNQIFDTAAPENVMYNVWAHNAHGDAPLTTEFQLLAGATMACPVEDIVAGLRGFMGEEPGWIFLQADRPTLSVVHYILQKGEDSLAVDHAF